MPFRITHLQSSDKLCRTLTWPILEQFFPRQRIEQLVETFYGQATRARKLTVVLVVWVLICWHLYLRHSLVPSSSSSVAPNAGWQRRSPTRRRRALPGPIGASNSACDSCAPSLKSRVCRWPPKTRRAPLACG